MAIDWCTLVHNGAIKKQDLDELFLVHQSAPLCTAPTCTEAQKNTPLADHNLSICDIYVTGYKIYLIH